MKKERKIAITVNHVRQDDEDKGDLLYWLGKSASERLSEVTRLRELHFASFDYDFPAKIEKTISQRSL